MWHQTGMYKQFTRDASEMRRQSCKKINIYIIFVQDIFFLFSYKSLQKNMKLTTKMLIYVYISIYMVVCIIYILFSWTKSNFIVWMQHYLLILRPLLTDSLTGSLTDRITVLHTLLHSSLPPSDLQSPSIPTMARNYSPFIARLKLGVKTKFVLGHSKEFWAWWRTNQLRNCDNQPPHNNFSP